MHTERKLEKRGRERESEVGDLQRASEQQNAKEREREKKQ